MESDFFGHVLLYKNANAKEIQTFWEKMEYVQ